MRKSLGRRMALRRPSEAEIKRLEEELAAAEAEDPPVAAKIAALRASLEHKQRLRRTIAYMIRSTCNTTGRAGAEADHPGGDVLA
jgi:uncharacterized sporulation protein YeaH/YhbH (DUF444 family)